MVLLSYDSNGNPVEQVIDLSTCIKVAVDENGNILPQPKGTTTLSSHTVGQGVTMYYYTSAGTNFAISANTSVTFNMSLNTTGTYQMGYKKSGGTATQCYSGSTSKTPSFTTSIVTAGNYCFYFTNSSAASVTVNSGSITF